MKLYFGGLVRTDIAVLSAPKVSPVELPCDHSACRFFGQPNAPASQPSLYFKLISVLVGRNLFSKLQLDNRTGQNGPLSCSEVCQCKEFTSKYHTLKMDSSLGVWYTWIHKYLSNHVVPKYLPTVVKSTVEKSVTSVY